MNKIKLQKESNVIYIYIYIYKIDHLTKEKRRDVQIIMILTSFESLNWN